MAAATVAVAAAGVLGWAEPASANVTGISTSVSSGGSCTKVSTPSGYDKAYACTMTEGDSLVVVGSANSNKNTLRLWWSSTGGVSDSESQGALQVHTLLGVTTYSRDNTGTLTCSSNGTATLWARDSSDTDKIKLTVTCNAKPRVKISWFSGRTINRTSLGRLEILESFTVSPSTATCSHSHVSGDYWSRSWADDTSSSRKLKLVTWSASGSSTVQVECSKTGYETDTDTATFAVNKPRVSISGWSGKTRDGPGEMSRDINVSPPSALCTASRSGGTITDSEADIDITDAGLSERTVDVDVTATGYVMVRLHCSRSDYTSRTITKKFTARRLAVSIEGWNGGTDYVGNQQIDSFRVRPTDAECTAERYSGLSGSDVDIDISGTGLVRTVTVDSDKDGTVRVKAECEADEYTTASSYANFRFRPTPKVRIYGFVDQSKARTASGKVTVPGYFSVSPSSAACTTSHTSAQAWTPHWGDRYSSSRRLDMSTYAATAEATVTVECTKADHDPAAATAEFKVVKPKITISGLHDRSKSGTALMSDGFTVSPRTATCDAEWKSGSAATAWVTGSTNSSWRTLYVKPSETGTAEVEVTCTKTWYETATDTANFRARPTVAVTGLDRQEIDGTGTLTDDIDVDPASAGCTAYAGWGRTAKVTKRPAGSSWTHRLTVKTTRTGEFTVRVTCNADDYDQGTAQAKFNARPSVRIYSFGGASKTRYGAGKLKLSDPFSVSPSNATCSDHYLSGDAWDRKLTVTGGSGRRLEVTSGSAGWGKATVEVTCSRDGYVSTSATAEFKVLKPKIAISGLHDRSKSGTAQMSDGFTVSPRTATCTAAWKSGSAATAEVTGSTNSSWRTLTVTPSETGTAEVEVTCTKAWYETAVDTASFRARPTVAVTGLEAQTRDGKGPMSAGFTVDPPTASCYAWRWQGIWANVKITDDEGPDRTVSVTTSGTGTAKVRVRCSADMWDTGYADADFRAKPEVRISYFDGASMSGAGTMTDQFSVWPSAATCEAKWQSGIGAVLDWLDETSGSRRLSVTTSATGKAVVKMTCSHTGYVTTSDTAEFVARPKVQISGLWGESRLGPGEMTDVFSVMPSDAMCKARRSGGIWSKVSMPDDSGWSRSVKAVTTASGKTYVRVDCSADDYDSAWKTAEFEAGPQVRIYSLGSTSRSGPGAMHDYFTVWPNDAECSARHHGGISTNQALPDNDGSSRKLTATTTEAGKATVEVTCSKDGYAPRTQTAKFTAREQFVRIYSFGAASRDGAGAMSRSFSVSPSNAVCSGRNAGGIDAEVSMTDNSGWSRRVQATTTTAGKTTVEVTCSKTGYTPDVESAVFNARTTVQITGFDGESLEGKGEMTESFTVSPTNAYCSAYRTSGRHVGLRWDDRYGSSRTLTVTAYGDGDSTLRVRCTRTGYVAGTAYATFSAGKQVDIRYFNDRYRNGTGNIDEQFSVYPGDASCTAARLWGTATLSWTDSTSSSRTLRAAAGTAGKTRVRVTCAKTGYADGTATATFDAREQFVRIRYLDDASREGAGRIDEWFSVSPSSAACTATHMSGISGPPSVYGSWSSRRLSATTTGTGKLTVTVTCTRTGYTPDSGTVTLTAHPPRVRVYSFTGANRSGPGAMDEYFTVSPYNAVCTAAHKSGIAADLSWPDSTSSSRRLRVDTDTHGRLEVTVTCTKAGLADGTATGEFVAGERHVRITGLNSRYRNGPGVMYDSFSVSPWNADCTVAEAAGGPEATASLTDNSGSSRRVTVEVTEAGAGSVTVTVTCSRDGYTAVSRSAKFTVRAAVAVTGFDGAERDGKGKMTDTFTVSPTDATCRAWRWTGQYGKLAWADDSGRTRSLTYTTTGTGEAWLRVQCSRPGYLTTTVSAKFSARAQVRVTGYTGAERPDPGKATDSFTVWPYNAVCTASHVSGPDAQFKWEDKWGSSRRLAVTTTSEGHVRVELTCSRSGFRDAVHVAGFGMPAEKTTVGDVSARAVSGGGCGEDPTPAAAVDEEWDCWGGRGGTLKVAVTAEDTKPDLSLRWPTASVTGGIKITAAQDDQAAFYPVDGRYRRTSTAKITCTADGTARAITSLDGTDVHTALIDVDCRRPVRIVGLDGEAASSGAITDRFTVTPSSADCSAAGTGIAANVAFTDDKGPERTVSVEVTGTGRGTVTVTVDCTAHGYAPGSASAEFVRTDSCTSDLGTLGHTTRTRHGTLSASNGCRSWTKGSMSSPHHARRYTIRVKTASKLTVDASSTGIDAYLYVLRGRESTATVLAEDADSGTANSGDARIVGVDVTPGLTYVIEVTTDSPREVGSYTLTATVAPDLPPVNINGLEDHTVSGPGAVDAEAAFAVEPAGAKCTSASLGAVTKPSAGPAGKRTLSARLTAPGSYRMTVTCTAEGRSDGAETVTFTHAGSISSVTVRAVTGGHCRRPPGAGAGFECVMSPDGDMRIAAEATASASALSASWTVTGNVTLKKESSGELMVDVGPDGAVRYRLSATATLRCDGDGTATAAAALSGAAAKTARAAVACRDGVRVSGLADQTLTGAGRVVFTDTFTVSPAAAVCSTTAGSIRPRTGTDRTLKVSLNAPRVRDVTVECTHPGRTPAKVTVTLTARQPCNSDLGVLPPGEVSRDGRITRDSKCVSVRRLDYPGDSGTYYARRHTFTLDSPGRVTFGLNADNPNQLDTFLVLLRGHGADGTAVGGDDDSGPSSDALLSGVKLAPGEYTIEATTSEPGDSGGYELSIDARLDVLIEHLDGASRPGTGTVHDYFRVTPSDATCTSSSGTMSDRENGWRVLSAQFTTLGDTTVTVTCTAAGYRTATATSTLTALAAVGDVTVEATANGTCTKSADTAEAGIDQKYVCTMTRGTKMSLSAEATGPSAQMTLEWAADAGVAVLAQPGHMDVSVVGGGVVFSRAGTGTVTCTSTADVTVRVSIGSKTEHATVVSVTCEPPVQITNYVPGERNGVGAMAAAETDALIGTFNVSPASATCAAANVGGIEGKPIAGGAGTSRTVTVSPAATGWLDIKVTCEADEHADSTATARFWARPSAACTVALGTLAHGTTTTTGTVGASLGCVSVHRNATSPTAMFHARRHTLTMATAGWANISLEPTATGANALDTYLLLLAGHGSGGKVLYSHNNLYGDATRLDDVFLPAGNYTIEATTATSGAVGGYLLAIDADFAVRSDDAATEITAIVGRTTKHRFDYLPHDASVSVTAAEPQRLAASVTAVQGSAAFGFTPTRAGNTAATVTFIASGHTSTRTITVKATCAPGYRALHNGTCTPLTSALPESCAQALAEGRTDAFGRQWKTNALSDIYENACVSVTNVGKAAAYYKFTIPATATSRTEYRAQFDISIPSAAKPFNGMRRTPPKLELPALSLIAWKPRRDGTLPNAIPVMLQGQQGSTADPKTVRYLADLTPGDYVIEVALHRDAGDQKTEDRRTDIASMFEIAASVPGGFQMHHDARHLGNIGRGGSGASLGQFLDARASLNYNAHPDEKHKSDPDDAFDPESPTYPWLVFTTDRCSIPPQWILALVEGAIIGFFNEHLHDYPLPISDLDLVREEYLTDRPIFGDAEVDFVYGCMRHDFNWRNFHRIHHHIDYRPPGGSWTSTVAKEANERLKSDLEALCDVNREGAPESHRHFDWEIRTDANNALCKSAARTIWFTLDVVVDIGEPLSFLPVLGIDYPHDG